MIDLSGWGSDVRQAGKRLVRSPGFTLMAVAILGIGIGINSAVFSLVDAALFRPPPYERPEEVVRIFQDSDDGEPSSAAFPAYRDIAAMTGVFAGVAATSEDVAVWEVGDTPRQARIVYATASYFPVLGLRPALGGWFSADQDRPGAGAFAVISHRTWTNEFGADPAIVGGTVRLNGYPVTVVGVGPENFSGPAGALVIDFWLSISSTTVGGDFRVANLDRRQDHWYDVVARLAPGVGPEQASAATDALALSMGELYPDLDRGRGLHIYTLDQVRFDPETDAPLFPVGIGLLVVTGLVLLLACSNLANLLLVRGLSRTPEVAVRRALGASSGRITRLFLAEAMLLSLLGGAAGIVMANWTISVFPRLPIPLPVVLDIGMDARVLAFGVALALLCGATFGLLPAAQARHTDLASRLREDLRGASFGRRGGRLRNVLVAVQVAASLVLLVGAGLFARSVANMRSVETGVDDDRLAVLAINVGGAAASSPEAAVGVFGELIARIGALPGVASVTSTTRLPAQRGGSTTTIVDGYEPVAGTDAVELPFAYVGPDYFATTGITLLAGRDFSPDDRPQDPRVVIVNETAARVFWGGDAIGKRTRSQGTDTPWREVVGVVSDTRVNGLQEPPTPMMYFTTAQAPQPCCFILARAAGDPEALLPAMRSALAEVAPQLPATRLGTLQKVLGEQVGTARTAALMMGGFSVLALLLATLGIYAVVSFAVTSRIAEIGIRVALGATRPIVMRTVLRDIMVTCGAGVVVGLVIAVGLASVVQDALFGVSSSDPATILAAALVLLAAALAASSIPAARATLASPMEVLRRR